MSQWWQAFKGKIFPVKLSRSLTEGEKDMARAVFGSAMDLDQIQINAAPWILKGYALSPNGNIYFHPTDWRADFSTATLSEKAWLIHELTHAWQVQKGIAVVRKALFNRKYSYKMYPEKPFGNYGVEQQAQMVQDYFVSKQRGQDCSAFEQCIPFANESKQT